MEFLFEGTWGVDLSGNVELGCLLGWENLWERCAINLAINTTVCKSLMVAKYHFMVLLLHKNYNLHH